MKSPKPDLVDCVAMAAGIAEVDPGNNLLRLANITSGMAEMSGVKASVLMANRTLTDIVKIIG